MPLPPARALIRAPRAPSYRSLSTSAPLSGYWLGRPCGFSVLQSGSRSSWSTDGRNRWQWQVEYRDSNGRVYEARDSSENEWNRERDLFRENKGSEGSVKIGDLEDGFEIDPITNRRRPIMAKEQTDKAKEKDIKKTEKEAKKKEKEDKKFEKESKKYGSKWWEASEEQVLPKKRQDESKISQQQQTPPSTSKDTNPVPEPPRASEPPQPPQNEPKTSPDSRPARSEIESRNKQDTVGPQPETGFNSKPTPDDGFDKLGYEPDGTRDQPMDVSDITKVLGSKMKKIGKILKQAMTEEGAGVLKQTSDPKTKKPKVGTEEKGSTDERWTKGPWSTRWPYDPILWNAVPKYVNGKSLKEEFPGSFHDSFEQWRNSVKEREKATSGPQPENQKPGSKEHIGVKEKWHDPHDHAWQDMHSPWKAAWAKETRSVQAQESGFEDAWIPEARKPSKDEPVAAKSYDNDYADEKLPFEPQKEFSDFSGEKYEINGKPWTKKESPKASFEQDGFSEDATSVKSASMPKDEDSERLDSQWDGSREHATTEKAVPLQKKEVESSEAQTDSAPNAPPSQEAAETTSQVAPEPTSSAVSDMALFVQELDRLLPALPTDGLWETIIDRTSKNTSHWYNESDISESEWESIVSAADDLVNMELNWIEKILAKADGQAGGVSFAEMKLPKELTGNGVLEKIITTVRKAHTGDEEMVCKWEPVLRTILEKTEGWPKRMDAQGEKEVKEVKEEQPSIVRSDGRADPITDDWEWFGNENVTADELHHGHRTSSAEATAPKRKPEAIQAEADTLAATKEEVLNAEAGTAKAESAETRTASDTAADHSKYTEPWPFTTEDPKPAPQQVKVDRKPAEPTPAPTPEAATSTVYPPPGEQQFLEISTIGNNFHAYTYNANPSESDFLPNVLSSPLEGTLVNARKHLILLGYPEFGLTLSDISENTTVWKTSDKTQASRLAKALNGMAGDVIDIEQLRTTLEGLKVEEALGEYDREVVGQEKESRGFGKEGSVMEEICALKTRLSRLENNRRRLENLERKQEEEAAKKKRKGERGLGRRILVSGLWVAGLMGGLSIWANGM